MHKGEFVELPQLLADALLAAPEQGDWPDDDHALGMAHFALDVLRHAGWTWNPPAHSDGPDLAGLRTTLEQANIHPKRHSDGAIPGLPNHRLDPETGDYVSDPLRQIDGDVSP